MVRACFHCGDPSHMLPACPLRRSVYRPPMPHPLAFRFPVAERRHGYPPMGNSFLHNNNQQSGNFSSNINNQSPGNLYHNNNQALLSTMNHQPRQQPGNSNFSKGFSGISPNQQVCQAYNFNSCEGPGCLDGRLHICSICFSREHRALYHTTSNNPSS